MKFTELPLCEEVLKGVEAAGFVDCTEVQEKLLPVCLTGRDVMVQSKTGSGKTAIYVLTILQRYVQAKQAGTGTPKALIVAPTRELAVQIEEDTIKLSCAIDGLTVGCFYGGVGYGKQDALLEKGCDIFVCTPGRILDYQKMHKIDFRQFDIFVVDEADRLFDMGFYPDVQKMFGLLRSCRERQTMLFSATLGTRVRNLAWSFMNEPGEFEVQPEEITVNKITQELYHISKNEKFGLFLQLMHRENPESCLIFTNTKARCIEVAKRLSLNGFPTKYLMGDMPQSKRLQTIDRMKEGKVRFLVATDVAARGLQIDDLPLVVNYDIPEDFESYVHRIGRTARAGKSGKAITLADEEFVYGLEAIEDYIQMKIPVIWPTEDELPKVEDKSASYSFRDLVPRDEYQGGGGSRSRSGGRPQRSRSGSSSHRGPARYGESAGRGRGDRNRSSAPPRNRTTGNRKPRRPQPERRPRGKSYAEMQNLSLEERLAYYKQQYQGERKEVSSDARKERPAEASRTKKPVPSQKGQTRGKPREDTPSKPKQGNRTKPKQGAASKPKQAPPSKPKQSGPRQEKKAVAGKETEKKKNFFARLFQKKKG